LIKEAVLQVNHYCNLLTGSASTICLERQHTKRDHRACCLLQRPVVPQAVCSVFLDRAGREEHVHCTTRELYCWPTVVKGDEHTSDLVQPPSGLDDCKITLPDTRHTCRFDRGGHGRVCRLRKPQCQAV
jgi:hypothetical protein